MTVRTPAKEIRGKPKKILIFCVAKRLLQNMFHFPVELNSESEKLQEQSESDAENSNSDEEMADSDVNDDEADNEFDGNESNEEVDDVDDEGNAGWADAFAKVLQQEKPKNKKYLVLSKAKKLSERADKSESDKKVTFEIADQVEEHDVKPDDADTKEAKPNNNDLELALIARRERNNQLQQSRVKPGAMDRERERSFKRIATKGVVQLFNAVRTQQRDLVERLEKAGPLDHKRDEVLNNINKRQFLDMLMGGKRAKSENVDNPIKDENSAEDDSSKPSQWSVLRDDFMTNKKLKHWDDEDEVADGAADVNNDDVDLDSD